MTSWLTELSRLVCQVMNGVTLYTHLHHPIRTEGARSDQRPTCFKYTCTARWKKTACYHTHTRTTCVTLYKLKLGFHSNASACVACVAYTKTARNASLQAANHGCHCFDRAFLFAGACVCCVNRLRNARNASDCVWMETTASVPIACVPDVRLRSFFDNFTSTVSAIPVSGKQCFSPCCWRLFLQSKSNLYWISVRCCSFLWEFKVLTVDNSSPNVPEGTRESRK